MSKLFPNITKHERELVDIIPDGSAKTYIYKDVNQKNTEGNFWNKLVEKISNKS
ncbi:hypothetical protein [Nostoc sp. 2RC]|uniref:hypothetical protein n=1 Tax=Nostoc sp. 2RC TaxID=2485484 RepID=UPI001628BB85|nr:hypothetical protein [Nostoc sp. 2RC]MBC1240551.1 hypothetical protein [Nostoc sp. 2RC]MDZ8239237.1 hypothetical protein [Nostoc sp. ChiQUE01a]